MTTMKIWDIEFEPMWPVPYCLIIAAETEEQALALAKQTIKHEQHESIKAEEVIVSGPMVIKYESGDY